MIDKAKLQAHVEKHEPQKAARILAGALQAADPWKYATHALRNAGIDRHRKAIFQEKKALAAQRTQEAAAHDAAMWREVAALGKRLSNEPMTPGQACGLTLLLGTLSGCSFDVVATAYPNVGRNNLEQRKHRALVRIQTLASPEVRLWLEKQLRCWKTTSTRRKTR